MIEKLKRKIFLIVFIPLTMVVLGVIIIFSILNYHNTINAAVFMINRMGNLEVPKEIGRPPKLEENELYDTNIEGMYHVKVENGKVLKSMQEEEIDETIKKYAIKISKQKKDSGIIDKYIYRVRRRGENACDITLMENEEAIAHANSILIASMVICVLSIFVLYIGSKKLVVVLVKPVEETFEKQKQFISDASHELKTPLAVIEANAEVLENEVKDNKWIKYIQNEIESMNQLINELLMLAKIENIDHIREIREINLSKELEIVVSMFESMAYEKDVILKSNIKENIKMKASREDIEHIVSTLLDNAIKHTKSKKQVIVELYKEKNEIVIQVKNDGDPIPEEEREKIFERFYRIDKSRNRKEKRYGLGLAIAKSTVQKYNGTIEVLYKDHFTIFKVIIPT